VIASDLKAKGGSSGTRLCGEALTCHRRCAVINTGLFTACLDFQHGPHYALPRVIPLTSHVEPVVTRVRLSLWILNLLTTLPEVLQHPVYSRERVVLWWTRTTTVIRWM